MRIDLRWLLLPVLAGVTLVACPLNYEGACVNDDNCPSGQICVDGKCRRSDGTGGSGGSSTAGGDTGGGSTGGGATGGGSTGGGSTGGGSAGSSGTGGGSGVGGGSTGGGTAGSGTGGGTAMGGGSGTAGGSTVEGPGTCADGIDNDSDTQTDCADSDCDNEVCRTAVGPCDEPETCSGNMCPMDAKKGPGTLCRPAVDGGCDSPETCDGTSDTCGPDGGVDVVAPAGTTCRTASAQCDAPESCDGTSPVCPSDGLLDAGTLCRMPGGDCDLPDYCDGVSRNCNDTLRSSSEVCRMSGGDCDPAENCNGTLNCPADIRLDNSTVCRPASSGGCDVEERCNGGTSCPMDGYRGMGAPCRLVNGLCDLEEQCTGSSPDCPMDRFAPMGTVCRPDAGVCDLTERCPGNSGACPMDSFATSGICRPSAGACDQAESCNGAASCPADVSSCPAMQWCSPTGCQAQKANGQTCMSGVECTSGHCFDGRCCNRSCGGDCEFCSTAGTCTFEPMTTICRPDAGTCDITERCTGSTSTCPSDTLVPMNQACRPSAGVCDPAEVCNGTSPACPPNALHGGSVTCRPALPAPSCDVEDVCDGTNPGCPADRVLPSMTECRGSAGTCDPAELCDGGSPVCPANAFAPANTACGLAFCINGQLTPAPRCTGGSNTCQMFSQVSCGGFQCNAAGDACRTSCADNTECISTHYCQNPGASGFCTPKIADGQPCVNNGDCVSGSCLTGYVDADNDNYGTGAPARFCTILPTSPTRYVATTGDCCDSNANVRPNQTGWFSSPVPAPCSGLGYNYNCSFDILGNPTIQHEYPVSGCTGYVCTASTATHCNYSFQVGGCQTSTGWSTASFPGCGNGGTLRSCPTFQINCNGLLVCGCGTATTSTVTDRCR